MKRNVNLPAIEVRGNEGPVYMNCEGVVASVLRALAAHVAANPDNLVAELQDINAVAAVEARDIYVEGPSADQRIEDLMLRLGTPTLELTAGLAIQYAQRLEEAADSVSIGADRDLRHQFKLREAQKMLSAAGFDVVDRPKDAGTAVVMRLGEARPAFVQPSHERTENNQIPSAQDVTDALINGEERS